MAGKKLVKKALQAYGMELPEFARHINHPKSTIQTWIDKDKVPRGGEIMLNLLIENKQLKEQVEATKKFFSIYGLNPN